MRVDRKTQEWIDKQIAAGRVSVGPSVALPTEPDCPVDDDVAEKAFQREVVKLAVRNGWKVFDRFDARKGRAGWPDLILIKGRRFMAWELKTATGKTTAEQDGWLEALSEGLSDHPYSNVAIMRPVGRSQIAALLEAP